MAATTTPLGGPAQVPVAPRRPRGGDEPDPVWRRGRFGRVARVLRWAALLGFTALFLYPLAWLVAASLKGRGQVFDNSLVPSPARWDNWVTVWHELPLLSWLTNSVAIAVLAAVTVAVRALLPHPDVSPARMMKLLESDPTTLPVLWPLLVEPVRHAAGLAVPAPRWLNRVLDVALLHAPLLREAADRGLLPADAAAWPGLRDLAERGGSATVRRKARTLVEQVLPG